jgi:membrane-associated protease RseP (regulator of RpoE activity)
MIFLSAHEFGHYIAARAHGVDATLPYFIPFPSFLGIAPFGTLGAVIRLRSQINERSTLLDIAAAGPIVGFLVSGMFLFIGFHSLPEKEYLYLIHPEYRNLALIPAGGLSFGRSLLYVLLEKTCTTPGAFVPPMSEVYHYPYLCAGWFGLFVTSLNLIPVGQLDGGHIVMALMPRFQKTIGRVALLLLVVLGTLGAIQLLGVDLAIGWLGWLVWGLVLALMLRKAPGLTTWHESTKELSCTRQVVGWLCLGIFCATFIPIPLSV